MRDWKAAWTAHRQTAGLLALMVIWPTAFHVWWVLPRRAELAEREAALSHRQAELARSRQETERIPAVEAGIGELEARLAAAQAAGVEAGDTTARLRRIESLAEAAGLSLRGYTPEPPLVHAVHTEWPIRLEIRGAYGGLLSVLAQLESCAAETAIGDLTLLAAEPADAADVADAETDAAAVRAAFTVTTFGLNDALPAGASGPPDATCRPAANEADESDAAPEQRAARADPFAPLPPPAEPPAAASRPPGLAGLRVGELTLQGLALANGRQLAVVAAPGGETYILHGGEQLLDGIVMAVRADGVVFREHEGASRAEREIRKALAPPPEER